MRNSIVAFACVVALTGCGSDDASSPGSGSDSPPVALQGTVNAHGNGDVTSGALDVEVDDFYFAPTYIKGTPGANITLNLKNEGAANHTFTVDSPKVDVTVAAGGTGVAGLTLPASGAVAFYCRFHKGQGMQGALFFKAGDTVAPGTSGKPSGDDGGAYGQ